MKPLLLSLLLGIAVEAHGDGPINVFPYANILATNLDLATGEPSTIWGDVSGIGATPYWQSLVETATENVIWGPHKVFYHLVADSFPEDLSIYEVLGERGWALELTNPSDDDFSGGNDVQIVFCDAAGAPYSNSVTWNTSSTTLVNSSPNDPDCAPGGIDVSVDIQYSGSYYYNVYHIALPAHNTIRMDWSEFFQVPADSAGVQPTIVVQNTVPDEEDADLIVQLHGHDIFHALYSETHDCSSVSTEFNCRTQQGSNTTYRCPVNFLTDWPYYQADPELYYHRVLIPYVREERMRAEEQGEIGDPAGEAMLCYIVNGDWVNSDKFRIVLRRPNGEIVNQQDAGPGNTPRYYTYETPTVGPFAKFRFSPSQLLKESDLPCIPGDFNLKNGSCEGEGEGEGEGCEGTASYPGEKIPQFEGSMEIWGNLPVVSTMVVQFRNTANDREWTDLDDPYLGTVPQFTKEIETQYATAAVNR